MGSDHALVLADSAAYSSITAAGCPCSARLTRLRCDGKRSELQMELRNRFDALLSLPSSGVEDLWAVGVAALLSAAAAVLPKVSRIKTPWISRGILDLADRRAAIRAGRGTGLKGLSAAVFIFSRPKAALAKGAHHHHHHHLVVST